LATTAQRFLAEELVPGAFQLLDLLTLQVFLFLLHQLFYIEKWLNGLFRRSELCNATKYGQT
jgi:hypothetical protein